MPIPGNPPGSPPARVGARVPDGPRVLSRRPATTPDDRATLLQTIALQRAGFVPLGCPFYDDLGALLVADVASDGPASVVLDPYAAEPFVGAYILRFFAGLHRLALSGAAPELAAQYPSPEGDGDPDAAFSVIQALCADPPAALIDAFARPPQTNEVGRSSALTSGLLVVADALRMPLSIREIGSSAGLNLRLDRYWYEQDGIGWGAPDAAVRFVDVWEDGAPPFDAPLEIVDRRGCDQDPIDATTVDGGLTLLSYIWPQPPERFERARQAIALAHDVPVTIDHADAGDWVPEQLARRPDGTALVVMHSVMWQYLDGATQSAIRTSLGDAGAVASADRPLAWVRLEPNEEHYVPAEVTVTLWDGSTPEGRERLVATAGFHGGHLTWRADA